MKKTITCATTSLLLIGILTIKVSHNKEGVGIWVKSDGCIFRIFTMTAR